MLTFLTMVRLNPTSTKSLPTNLFLNTSLLLLINQHPNTSLHLPLNTSMPLLPKHPNTSPLLNTSLLHHLINQHPNTSLHLLLNTSLLLLPKHPNTILLHHLINQHQNTSL